MQPASKPVPDHSGHRGKSGLRDPHRRVLMRIIFAITALILAIFACLQFAGGNYPRAFVEAMSVAALIVGFIRIGVSPYLWRWIIGYLIPLYVFLVWVMLEPAAPPTKFVWAYAMPVLSYLLLGRRAGLLLAGPFMLAAAIGYVTRFGSLADPAAYIELFTPILCGLVTLIFIHLYETMRAEAEEELVYYAETDALTGLPNRSRFQTTFERTLEEARRSGVRFSLALMDIDHFKNVNDTRGHDAGDTALISVSSCLGRRLRSTDFVGRLGGEEFGLILRDTNAEAARALVEELRQRIADTSISYGGERFSLTVTFGVACWPTDADTTNGLYQVADRRMYLGKHRGRNRVVCEDETNAAAPAK